MRFVPRRDAVCLLLLVPLLACIMVGCPPPIDEAGPPIPVPSTTAPPGVSVPPSVTTPLAADPAFVEPIEPEPEPKAAPEPEMAAPPERAPAAPVLGDMVPLDIELPAPAFRGTPKPAAEPNLEEPLGKPRPPFLAPEGTVNLARGKPVIASDPMPAAGEVDFVTDGDKEASDFGYLELRSGPEWVQIDLGQRATVYAVLFWHNHAEARVYRDVVVQVSDDPDFLEAYTVFNNDYDNSSGLGVGPDKGYVETSEGKLVDAKGVEGRYVRLYSNGNHMENKNHYTEVEVFGKPAG